MKIILKIVKRLMIAIVTLVLLAMIFILLGIDNRLRTETYRLSANTGAIRIAVIADLHNAIYGEKQQPLIDAVIQSKPDLIFIVGDIADSVQAMQGARLLLSHLKPVAPMYYVSGNHEYWSGHVADIKATIASYGVHVLGDTYVRLDIRGSKLILAGIEDEAKTTHLDGKYDQMAALSRLSKRISEESGGYKILLSHRPNAAYAAYPFDLVVSGHVHGGHVRIPILDIGVAGPERQLFPRYCSGAYKIGAQTLVISRGLSLKRAITPRLYNPPELSVIELGGG